MFDAGKQVKTVLVIRGVAKKNPFRRKQKPIFPKFRILVQSGRRLLGPRHLNSCTWPRLRLNFYVGVIHANLEVRPSLEVPSRDKGIFKKLVGCSIDMAPRGAIRVYLRAIRHTRLLFRCCTSDLIGNKLAR